MTSRLGYHGLGDTPRKNFQSLPIGTMPIVRFPIAELKCSTAVSTDTTASRCVMSAAVSDQFLTGASHIHGSRCPGHREIHCTSASFKISICSSEIVLERLVT